MAMPRMLPSFLGVTAADGYSSKAVAAKGTPYLRPRTLDVRPYNISGVNSFSKNLANLRLQSEKVPPCAAGALNH